MILNLFALYILPIGLVLFAGLTVAFVGRRSAALIRELADVDGVLAMIRDGDHENRLVRTIREHIVPVTAAASGRIVLSRPLPAVRREYAEDEVARQWPFWVGSLFTGVALIATFLLIARVMTSDVSGAIRESANADEAASAHLSSAVAALGGKFLISAAGIGGSVVALFVTTKARARIYRCAEHPAPGLLAAFTSLEAEQVRAQELEMELWRQDLAARDKHHVEIAAQLASLNQRMERLHSIEVSVKGIGDEVSANLKNVMKEAMGEQLVLILRDTMVDVDRIATTVQTNLTTAFGDQLRGLTTELQQALGAVQRAIEGQGQGHLEQILDKLQNTVSGGFDRESHKMAAALESFAAVVPVLEQQLKAMTTTVAAESRQHAEEAARVSGTVLDRMTSLVEALAAQQDAGAQALDRMVLAAEQGAGVLAQRLASTSETVVSGVLSASRNEMDAIATTLRQAAESTAARYGAFDERAAQASTAMTAALDGMVQAADHGAGVLAQRFASTSETIVSGVLSASRTEMEAIAANLRQVAEATAARYGAFDERAALASTAISAAAAELVSAAATLRSERKFTESAFAQVKAGGEAIQTASKGFALASASLGTTATGVQALVKAMQAQGSELQTVAAQQQKHTSDMERVWPELFKTYLTQFKTAADELARSWSELYRRVEQLTNAVGGQFADNTDQLAEAVDRLATTLRGDSGPAGPAPGPAPKPGAAAGATSRK